MLLPISKFCGNQYAGIRHMWAIECHNITGVLFDSIGQIIAIDRTAEWQEIEFERNTGFLLQEKKIVGRNTVIVQQKIYFEQDDILQSSLEALYQLNCSGCLNVVIEDNNGQFHYCGVSKTDNPLYWYHQDFRTSDGTANTNSIDSEIGTNLTESLSCATNNYAPFVSESPITISPTADLIYYAGGFAFITSPSTVLTLRS